MVSIGEYSIINTYVYLDHECIYIATGTTLCGCIEVNDYSFIGAGAVVTKDIKDNTTVYGVPAIEHIKS